MTRLIGQVLARVLRCRRWLRSGLWGRYDLSIWANGRWRIEDRRVGVSAHGAERLGFRRDSIISDRFARREIRPLGHCLGLSHQTRASLARSRIHPQNAEHHRRPGENQGGIRSEEHTSELQSLMRISYAVFCLKKKKKKKNRTQNIVIDIINKQDTITT